MSQHRHPKNDPFGIVGTVVDGRFHVERLVGEGGFAVAYRARHLQFEAPVAIKVLKSSVTRPDSDEALRAEGRILLKLSSLHPAIVRAFEMGLLPGTRTPYLVLEWLDGLTLAAELKRRKADSLAPWTLRETIALLDPVAEGLAVAHANGVAHRDIKPQNIFLAAQNGSVRAKILDFGLAKVADDLTTTTELFELTGGGPMLMTPAYAAPEQWLRRLGATGTWTDVYAVALVFLELLRGRPAIEGDSREQLMAACIDGFRPTPRALGLDVSDAMEDLFGRALAIDPRARPRTVGDFWRELRAAASDSPEAAMRDGTLAPVSIGAIASALHDDAETGPLSIERSHAGESADSRRARGRLLWSGALFPIALVASVAAWAGEFRGAPARGPDDAIIAPASASTTETAVAPLPMQPYAEVAADDVPHAPAMAAPAQRAIARKRRLAKPEPAPADAGSEMTPDDTVEKTPDTLFENGELQRRK